MWGKAVEQLGGSIFTVKAGESYMSVQIGTPVCILCDLIYYKKNNKFALENIEYIGRTFDSLKAGLRTQSTVLYGLYILLIGGGAYFAIRALSRAANLGRNLSHNEGRERLRREAELRRQVD